MATNPIDPGETGLKRLTITEVASRLHLRYHKARDWMLRGKFGVTEYDPNTRALTISLGGIMKYEAEQRRLRQEIANAAKQ